MAHTFSKSERLLTQSDFKQAFHPAKKITHPFFRAYFHPTHQAARLGLAISKKNVRLAVKRNLIKRIIRESFRYHRDALTGFDIIILVNPAVNDVPKNVLREVVDSLWQKKSYPKR